MEVCKMCLVCSLCVILEVLEYRGRAVGVGEVFKIATITQQYGYQMKFLRELSSDFYLPPSPPLPKTTRLPDY